MMKTLRLAEVEGEEEEECLREWTVNLEVVGEAIQIEAEEVCHLEKM